MTLPPDLDPSSNLFKINQLSQATRGFLTSSLSLLSSLLHTLLIIMWFHHLFLALFSQAPYKTQITEKLKILLLDHALKNARELPVDEKGVVTQHETLARCKADCTECSRRMWQKTLRLTQKQISQMFLKS